MDPILLNRLPRTERSKALARGVVVLLSALLMAVAQSYAAYIIFSDVAASLVLGAVSGALMLSLHRLILTTYAGEKVRSPVRLLGVALPLIFVTLLMAVITSLALSIGIFRNDIDQRLLDKAGLGAQSVAERVAAQSSEIRSLQIRIASAEERVQRALADYSRTAATI
jgi:hypothetical protein